VNRVGFRRKDLGLSKKGGRKWKKTADLFRCTLCRRLFDTETESQGYLTEVEVDLFVQKLEKVGLSSHAAKIRSRQAKIHRKSRLGQLFMDLQQNSTKESLLF
jgi:hypothetical protein